MDISQGYFSRLGCWLDLMSRSSILVLMVSILLNFLKNNLRPQLYRLQRTKNFGKWNICSFGTKFVPFSIMFQKIIYLKGIQWHLFVSRQRVIHKCWKMNQISGSCRSMFKWIWKFHCNKWMLLRCCLIFPISCI